MNWKAIWRTPTTSPALLRHSFERRVVLLGAVQGGLGLLLGGRLAYLSVAQNEKYQLDAESNRVNLTLIPPRRRGWRRSGSARNRIPAVRRRPTIRPGSCARESGFQ